MRTCKKCGLQIAWKKTLGRWQCFDPDGAVHWDKCSQERTRVALKEGKPFADEKGEGVIHAGKKKYMHMMAETHYGKPVK